MRFRLTQRSLPLMTLTRYNFEFAPNFAGFRRCESHHHHHHHHRDAKRSAGASRRYDRSPERSVLRYLQGLGRCYTRVAADLVGPGGRRSTTGASPLL